MKNYHFVTTVLHNRQIYTKDTIDESGYYLRRLNNYRYFSNFIKRRENHMGIVVKKQYEKFCAGLFSIKKHTQEYEQLLYLPLKNLETSEFKPFFLLNPEDKVFYKKLLKVDLQYLISKRNYLRKMDRTAIIYVLHLYLFDCISELLDSIERQYHLVKHKLPINLDN